MILPAPSLDSGRLAFKLSRNCCFSVFVGQISASGSCPSITSTLTPKLEHIHLSVQSCPDTITSNCSKIGHGFVAGAAGILADGVPELFADRLTPSSTSQEAVELFKALNRWLADPKLTGLSKPQAQSRALWIHTLIVNAFGRTDHTM